eukprot:scaffold7432_cov107-Isochrysis_galbana.AAC.5
MPRAFDRGSSHLISGMTDGTVCGLPCASSRTKAAPLTCARTTRPPTRGTSAAARRSAFSWSEKNWKAPLKSTASYAAGGEAKRELRNDPRSNVAPPPPRACRADRIMRLDRSRPTYRPSSAPAAHKKGSAAPSPQPTSRMDGPQPVFRRLGVLHAASAMSLNRRLTRFGGSAASGIKAAMVSQVSSTSFSCTSADVWHVWDATARCISSQSPGSSCCSCLTLSSKKAKCAASKSPPDRSNAAATSKSIPAATWGGLPKPLPPPLPLLAPPLPLPPPPPLPKPPATMPT